MNFFQMQTLLKNFSYNPSLTNKQTNKLLEIYTPFDEPFKKVEISKEPSWNLFLESQNPCKEPLTNKQPSCQNATINLMSLSKRQNYPKNPHGIPCKEPLMNRHGTPIANMFRKLEPMQEPLNFFRKQNLTQKRCDESVQKGTTYTNMSEPNQRGKTRLKNAYVPNENDRTH